MTVRDRGLPEEVIAHFDQHRKHEFNRQSEAWHLQYVWAAVSCAACTSCWRKPMSGGENLWGMQLCRSPLQC
jgi:hypothetical protein